MVTDAVDGSGAPGADRTFVARFERRARFHGLLAGLVFVLIAALVAFAGYVFFFAASITSRDIQRDRSVHALDRDSLAILESSLAAQQALSDIYFQQFEIGQRDLLDLARAEGDMIVAKRQLALARVREEAGRPIGTDLERPDVNSKKELEAVIALLAEQTKTYETFQTLAQEQERSGIGTLEGTAVISLLLERTQLELNLLNAQILQVRDDAGGGLEVSGVDLTNYEALIQTSVTRFGTMIVVFFFISILVPLYRYNMRLTVFYHSIADALLISHEDGGVSLAEIAPVLNPSWGFDAPPETPTQQAAQMFERVAGAVKRS